jgi:hypothetical protein
VASTAKSGLAAGQEDLEDRPDGPHNPGDAD